jgi:hypothetical protein
MRRKGGEGGYERGRLRRKELSFYGGFYCGGGFLLDLRGGEFEFCSRED